ncbi:nitrous oxide reductase family maturation protein NosD [Rhodovibrionaceae bacterium A322]
MASCKLARWMNKEAGRRPASRPRKPVPPPITALRLLLSVWVVSYGCLSQTATALAADILVPAGQDHLQQALTTAQAGDHLLLESGDHAGPVLLDKPLTLTGKPGARVVGSGQGHVIVVDAPDSTIQGLEITGSGLLLESEDSGIFITKKGRNAQVLGNNLHNNLIGVYLKGPKDALVRGNRISGRKDLRINERGNGVQLWNTPGSVVEGNDIRQGRDGIFVTTSKRNAFRNNHFQDLRFAVHYMYTHRSEISGNISRGNHVGYAIMFSDRLDIRGNLSLGDRDRGLAFNYANKSKVRDNKVVGAERCVFIYNSNQNSFQGNRFESCDIGIHFTAGSEKNSLAGNAFIGSRTQVKYVGTRQIEWSEDGRGNYWSDNLAFDLNGDGLADRPYQPNDMVDQLLWRFPQAKLLLSSPALQVLRWAQSEFPGLYPGGVTDSAPLIEPPNQAAEDRAQEEGTSGVTLAALPPFPTLSPSPYDRQSGPEGPGSQEVTP